MWIPEKKRKITIQSQSLQFYPTTLYSSCIHKYLIYTGYHVNYYCLYRNYPEDFLARYFTCRKKHYFSGETPNSQ